jgi:hypothetical protein
LLQQGIAEKAELPSWLIISFSEYQSGSLLTLRLPRYAFGSPAPSATEPMQADINRVKSERGGLCTADRTSTDLGRLEFGQPAEKLSPNKTK